MPGRTVSAAQLKALAAGRAKLKKLRAQGKGEAEDEGGEEEEKGLGDTSLLNQVSPRNINPPEP